jgi:hypothetical protein
MPFETLPGNPTEAGPMAFSPTAEDKPPSWDECLIFAEESTCNSRRTRRVATSADVVAQLAAIHEAREWLLEAEFNLLGMLKVDEIVAMRLSNAQ